ncbi:unnamed protein product [Caenorhabditis bovis]|uniref:G-protein coupled receptors family 1 profile domain-containing protein n=1 Tax=Caenorhabditis bovis TaxID=2654633 RepID=A0A8S1EQ62_9PELO|nr:unnamed protein product [Caenorhabditis bovis]
MLNMQDNLVLWPSEMVALPQPVFIFLFAFIVCLGLVLNMYVIYRMILLNKRDRDQFMNGTGIYLLAMAICDTTSLLLSYFQMSLSHFTESIPIDLLKVMCKASEFITRCSYTYSMYCWLFMSGLRYLAAFHPLRYSTVWRSPYAVLLPAAVATFVMNMYLLTAVGGSKENCGCFIKLEAQAVLYSTVDVIISTCVPGIFILTLDLQVLCCRMQRKPSDPLLQIVFHKLDEDAEKKRLLTIRRFMLVTLVAMSSCIPDGLLRGIRPFLNLNDVFLVFYIAKSLYLTKFSFNAFYLSLFVFDRNLMSKTSSSRHLSVSARRLEDEPAILPRERSRTLSCRGTSPIPILTRNSSCIIYNDGPECPGKQWV